MTYKLIVTPIAQEQLEEAFIYYRRKASENVAKNFRKSIIKVYKTLETNPFFEIRTLNYRAIPIKNFPYLVFFELNEIEKVVKILAIFNTNLNTDKYPI
jgi:plasmid stabilization system protein ParE